MQSPLDGDRESMLLSLHVQKLHPELAYSYRRITDTTRYESTLFRRISPTPSLMRRNEASHKHSAHAFLDEGKLKCFV